MSDSKPSIEMIVDRQDYLALAREQYQSDGEIEFDHGAVVSIDEDVPSGTEEGAYVAAWVWVDRPGKEDE
jgi:hypothetical protein